MAEVPHPEHYGAFKDWIEAARLTRGLNQSELGRALEVPRQTIYKWRKGETSPTEVETLERIAIWSGHPYVAVRLLIDEVPPPGSHRARVRAAKARHPKVEYIASRLDQLADDEDFIATIEDMVDAHLKRRVQAKQKKQQAS